MENYLEEIKPVIMDDSHDIDAKMEVIAAAFTRELKNKLNSYKSEAIRQVNACEDFDKRDARLIIKSL